MGGEAAPATARGGACTSVTHLPGLDSHHERLLHIRSHMTAKWKARMKEVSACCMPAGLVLGRRQVPPGRRSPLHLPAPFAASSPLPATLEPSPHPRSKQPRSPLPCRVLRRRTRRRRSRRRADGCRCAPASGSTRPACPRRAVFFARLPQPLPLPQLAWRGPQQQQNVHQLLQHHHQHHAAEALLAGRPHVDWACNDHRVCAERRCAAAPGPG